MNFLESRDRFRMVPDNNGKHIKYRDKIFDPSGSRQNPKLRGKPMSSLANYRCWIMMRFTNFPVLGNDTKIPSDQA